MDGKRARRPIRPWWHCGPVLCVVPKGLPPRYEPACGWPGCSGPPARLDLAPSTATEAEPLRASLPLLQSSMEAPGPSPHTLHPPSLHPPQPPARAARPSLLQGGPGSRCPHTPAQARLSPAVTEVLLSLPGPVTAAGREIPSRHCETQASVAFRDKSHSYCEKDPTVRTFSGSLAPHICAKLGG